MQEALKDYKSSEVHCIEAIHELDNPNVRSLTEQLFMTRGAISKLTKRLQSKKLVESYQNEHNKKFIFDLRLKDNKYITHINNFMQNLMHEIKTFLKV